MIIKIFFMCLLFVVFGCQAFAQTASGCLLSGKITDLLGNPLPLTKIEVEDAAKNKLAADVEKDGGYSVGGFLCGQITVVYAHQGFRRETLEMNLAKGETKVFNLGLEVGRFTDTPVIRIKGKILDQRKKGIAGAKIDIRNVLNNRVVKSTVSKSNGAFELIIDNEGKYIFEVSAAGNRRHQFEIFIDYMRNQEIKLEDIVLNSLTK